MNKRAIAPICLCLVMGVELAHSQEPYPSTQYEKMFEQGKEMFEQRNYVGCEDHLTRFLKHFTNQDMKHEALYMLAASAYERNQPNAVELLTDFCNTYAWSPRATDATLMVANSYFFDKSYKKARSVYAEIDINRLPQEVQSDYMYRMGLSTLLDGDREAAKPYFKALTAVNNRYSTAAEYYIAYIQYCDGKFVEAATTFTNLSEDPEFGQQSSYYLAQIYSIQERYPEVITLAEKLLREYPDGKDNAELYRLLGDSYFQMGEDEKTIEYLSCYTAAEPDPQRRALYQLGVAYYRVGEYDKSISAMSKVVGNEDSLSQNSYLYLGQSYLKLGDKQSARMAFEQAASDNYETKESYVQEAALYNYALTIHETAYSPFDESVVVFERFLNLFPKSRYADQINDYLVEVYLTTRNYRTALASIEKIKQPTAKILSAKQRLLFQLGTEYFINGDLPKAESNFTQAIDLGNYDKEAKALAYFWRGECDYRNQDYAGAAENYQLYLTTTPNRAASTYALAHYNRGYAFFKQHNFVAAQLNFLKYIELSEDAKMLADACNRIGDSYYSNRDFLAAQQWYSKANAYQPQSGDYAQYQKGLMAGLQGKTAEKVEILNKLVATYPTSEYVDDALFESGLASVQLKKYDQAIGLFDTIVKKYPQSAIARKAGLQLGVVYFNSDKPDLSIEAYKHVIESYKGSQEARIAAEDLKSVYLELNDIASYAAYIAMQDDNITFDASEQDSLTYIAAERAFMKGSKAEAVKSFQSYLLNFPRGVFATSAHYYLGAYYYDNKQYDMALDRFETVLQHPDSPFGEEALVRMAQIYNHNKEYEKALKSYEMLELKSSRAENLLLARLGVLRMNQQLGRDHEVVLAANKLLKDAKLSPELATEARFARAMALLQEQQGDAAVTDFIVLAKDPRTAYGAQATYELSQYYFDNNRSDEAQKQLNDFVAAGTSHQYWLARGFILLADINMKKGDLFQAKQLLLSLKNNYKGEDDIAAKIEERLLKIDSNTIKE